DDWKGAFSFPFTLHFIREGCSCTYLLDVHTCRDSLYFPFRKVVAPDDPRLQNRIYHPPIPDEFSWEESNRFVLHFYGYLHVRLSGLDAASIAPFVRHVPASLIIFGHCGGTFFEQEYESEEDYRAALESYQRQGAQESTREVRPDITLGP